MKAELVFHDKVVGRDNSIVEVKIWSVDKLFEDFYNDLGRFKKR